MGSRLSKNRFIYLIILACVIIPMGIIFFRAKLPGKYTGPMPDCELVLTKAWNGEVVRVPGLLDVPQWMKKTWEYRKLMMRSRPVELTWKDLNGNTYIADAPGGRWKKRVENILLLFPV